jgi:hypothetical protein
VLGLRRSIWTRGEGFLVGLAIVTVAWAIVAGKDVVAIVGDVLTFLTLLAAVAALRYAVQPAQAALATVEPMEAMATNLATAAARLHDMQSSLTATAETLKANLELVFQADQSRGLKGGSPGAVPAREEPALSASICPGRVRGVKASQR